MKLPAASPQAEPEGNALAVAVQSHSGEEDPEEEGSEEQVVAEKPPGLRTETRKGACPSHTLTGSLPAHEVLP